MRTLKWIAAILVLVVVSGLLLFMVSGFGKNRNETPDASIPEPVRNLPLKNTKSGPNVIIARLQEETLIDGFSCAADWVHFTRSGQLSKCTLSEDVVVQNNLIPGNTWVVLDEDLNLKYCSFPKDTEIQGYLCKGGAGGSEGTSTAFYHGGRLKAFYAPSNVMIQGIPCGKGFSSPIYLHENGNLKECTTSSNLKIGTLSIPARSDIAISEDGEVTILDDSLARRMKLRIAEIFD